MASGVALICLGGLVGCTYEDPAAAPAVTATAPVTDKPAGPAESRAGSEMDTPTAPATASSTPRGRPAQTGSSVVFKNFKVTVRQVQRGPQGVRVLADVCVRRLPPDPQGNRTRISWDPWSVTTGSGTVDAAGSSRSPGVFPAEGTYRVGECASGWIPFPTEARPLKINYANGVGDAAVWDANDISKKPRIG